MKLKEVFIRNLKRLRKERGFSQMKLAEKCDTATSYIGEIEIGRKFPSVDMVEKIALALNIEAYYLFVNPEKARHDASSVELKVDGEAGKGRAPRHDVDHDTILEELNVALATMNDIMSKALKFRTGSP
jgi:transcriptional regulator with XRE-family HTH domain